MGNKAAGPEPAVPDAVDEDAEIRRLATAPAGEPSWEAVTRKRELMRLLEQVVLRDMPGAIGAAKAADVPLKDLATAWKVSQARISQIRPQRKRQAKK